VIDPVRAAPEFAAIANDTVPFPVPEPPLVIVIHDAFDVAVHAQVDADAVTAIDPDPAFSLKLASAAPIENVHGAGAAACAIVNVLLATVIDPLRAPPVFAATRNATVPFPVPDAPDVTVIHTSDAAAVHAQPNPALT
jgi:hypothetical protein